MRAVPFVLFLAACSGASDPVTPDAPNNPGIDAPDVDIDAPPAVRIIVINEVAAQETPDWIEDVNVSNAPVQLSDFVFVDVEGDFAKAFAFPQMTLDPGERFAQDVDDPISGFKLGSDEAVFIYRASDQALSDSVDWDEGAAPTGMSFRRIPDTTGDFATGAQTKGTAN
jgi:hypothetical protein